MLHILPPSSISADFLIRDKFLFLTPIPVNNQNHTSRKDTINAIRYLQTLHRDTQLLDIPMKLNLQEKKKELV